MQGKKRSQSRSPARLCVLVELGSGEKGVIVPGVVTDFSPAGVRLVVNGSDLGRLAKMPPRRLEAGELVVDVTVQRGPETARDHNGIEYGLLFVDEAAASQFRRRADVSAAAPLRPGQRIEIDDTDAARDAAIERLLARFGESWPLENILHRMIRARRAQVILLTSRPIESGATESFSRGEHLLHLRPVRISFFRDTHSGEFLGFTEVRPTEITVPGSALRLGHVGYSVLTYPEGSGANPACGLDRQGTPFYLIQTRYRATVRGKALFTHGMQFEQQSVVVGSCGHAAVAMASGFLHQLLKVPKLTQAAVSHDHGFGPGDNLTEAQFASAFAKIGLRPRCYYSRESYLGPLEPLATASSPQPACNLVEILHFAADSYLPALVCLADRDREGPKPPAEHDPVADDGHRERHVMTVAGHTTLGVGQEPAATANKLAGLDFGSSTEWVREFLVHDDAVGPYLRLPITDPYAKATRPYSLEDYAKVWRRCVVHDVDSVVVPFPREVRMDPTHVPLSVQSLIRMCLERQPWSSAHGSRDDDGNAAPTPELDALSAAYARGPTHIVVNNYLDHASRFRVSMCETLESDAYRERAGAARERELLESVHLPTHVYVVSVMLRDEVVCQGTLQAEMVGYVVVDATATPNSRHEHLFVRLGEFVHYHHPATGLETAEIVPFVRRRQPGTLGLPV